MADSAIQKFLKAKNALAKNTWDFLSDAGLAAARWIRSWAVWLGEVADEYIWTPLLKWWANLIWKWEWVDEFIEGWKPYSLGSYRKKLDDDLYQRMWNNDVDSWYKTQHFDDYQEFYEGAWEFIWVPATKPVQNAKKIWGAIWDMFKNTKSYFKWADDVMETAAKWADDIVDSAGDAIKWADDVASKQDIGIFNEYKDKFKSMFDKDKALLKLKKDLAEKTKIFNARNKKGLVSETEIARWEKWRATTKAKVDDGARSILEKIMKSGKKTKELKDFEKIIAEPTSLGSKALKASLYSAAWWITYGVWKMFDAYISEDDKDEKQDEGVKETLDKWEGAETLAEKETTADEATLKKFQKQCADWTGHKDACEIVGQIELGIYSLADILRVYKADGGWTGTGTGTGTGGGWTNDTAWENKTTVAPAARERAWSRIDKQWNYWPMYLEGGSLKVEWPGGKVYTLTSGVTNSNKQSKLKIAWWVALPF